MFVDDTKENNHCKRETILGARKTDWMEWQAGHAAGALLIPMTPLRSLCRNFYQKNSLSTISGARSPQGRRLILDVVGNFQVSEDAARVRLLQLKFLTEHQQSPRF